MALTLLHAEIRAGSGDIKWRIFQPITKPWALKSLSLDEPAPKGGNKNEEDESLKGRKKKEKCQPRNYASH